MILNKLNQNKKTNEQKTEKYSQRKIHEKQMDVEVQISPHKQFGYFL